MNKVNKMLDKNITKLILIFIFLSPIFDLITSLFINVFEITNYVIFLKVGFLGVLIYYLFFISKSKHKKNSLIYLGLIFVYLIAFILVTMKYKPGSFLMMEITNLIRTFYFPIFLICIFNIYNKKKLNIEKKHLFYILITYIGLIFIPQITKTGFNSYAYSKGGSIGWFNSCNEIGGILSILLPILICYLYEKKNIITSIITLIISLIVYFSMGTKVPVLSILIVIMFIVFRYFVKIVAEKQVKKIIVIIVLLAIGLIGSIIVIPKTDFYKNLVIHTTFLEVDELSDIVNPTIIDKLIFSERVTFYTRTKMDYLKSTRLEQLFGIGYSEHHFDDPTLIKTIEIDYYDVLFRYGIIGFLLFFIPYIIILRDIYLKLIKTKLNNTLFYLYISLILILLLALFSGHILTAPSVSSFVTIILLMLYKELRVSK